MRNRFLLTSLILFIILTGCSDYRNDKIFNEEIMICKSDLSSLPGKRVYFAHQSVGSSILDGINRIIERNNELKFIKIITLDEFLKSSYSENDSNFYIVHSKIGRNMYPFVKITEFKNNLASMPQINAAFLKFCFVDINRMTDVNALYNHYMETMEALENQYQDTRFLYFTCPISAKENFIFGIIKAVLRRPDDLNRNRHRYNDIIRSGGEKELFDIAYLESHDENDKRVVKKEYLLKKYAAKDGAHLNNFGAEKIAENLLRRLDKLLK